MLKQFDEKIRDYLLGLGKKSRTIKNRSEQLKLLYECMRVRNTDYLVYFDSKETLSKQVKEIVTRANWYFILTNCAVWFDSNVSKFPKIAIRFLDLTPNSPFRSEGVPGGAVLSKLNFGRETDTLDHFEEYKNLFVALGQRIAIDVEFEPVDTDPIRGAVLLTGIEINTFNEG